MGISSIFSRMLIRYSTNSVNLSSSSQSSSSKTLNPYLVVTYLFNHFHTCSNHKKVPPLCVSSVGSPSICSIKFQLAKSFHSFSFYRNNVHFYLVSSRVPLRSMYLFTSRTYSVHVDGSLSLNSLEIPSSYSNSGSGDLGTARIDKYGLAEQNFGGSGSYASAKQVSEIIELVRNGAIDIECKLYKLGLYASVQFVIQIFLALNSEKTSALRFFRWARHINPNLYYSSDICSLIIDNCGRRHDHETMILLLKEFKSNNICLNEKAFGFLCVHSSSENSLKDSVKRLIDLLNKIGGSCRNSGVWALIRAFSLVNLFDMAKFVIQITEMKMSYYNPLVSEMCKRGYFKEVRNLFEEMRACNAAPDAQLYNYLLGCLCSCARAAEAFSVLKEMQVKGSLPDATTFEILIYFLCRLSRFDHAAQFLEQMVTRGIEPRLRTHGAFIRGYFNARKYEEAHKYVVEASIKYVHASNMIYSLLARLHQEKGDLVVARNILIEMMDKGLRPNFSVYQRVKKRLLKTGPHFVGPMKSRFSKFKFSSSTNGLDDTEFQ